jgi:drug/metabolite transporter (DMT)-like permease
MKLRTLLPPLVAVLIWGGNTVVSKAANGLIDPAAISFYRWLLAGLLLAAAFARPVWRERRQIRPHLPKLFVLGLLGMVLYQCLAYTAAQTTTATHMGIIASLIPLLAVVMSMILLGATATVGSVAGGLLSLCGLAYLLSHGEPASLLAHGPVLGDGLMLLASLAYATYSVLLKRWALPLNSWHSLLLQVWCVMPVLFLYYLSRSAPPLTVAGLPLVMYAGFPASVIAPYLWMRGVQQLGPSRTATMMNLLPVSTVIIAVLFLGESLQAYHLIGGGITLFGVVMAQYLKKPLLGAGRLATADRT